MHIKICLKPNNPLSYSNISSAHQNQGKYSEALEAYKQSILLDPICKLHKNLSFTLLSCGNYQEGLDEYEWRWKTEEVHQI